LFTAHNVVENNVVVYCTQCCGNVAHNDVENVKDDDIYIENVLKAVS